MLNNLPPHMIAPAADAALRGFAAIDAVLRKPPVCTPEQDAADAAVLWAKFRAARAKTDAELAVEGAADRIAADLTAGMDRDAGLGSDPFDADWFGNGGNRGVR